jgi:predicted phage-related endonuclease
MLSHEEWLAERRKHIGASDCAAILGFDPRRGPLAVYEEKVLGRETPDNDWLRFGRKVEGAIADMYAVKTGREVEDMGATHFEFHPLVDFPLACTLDRTVMHGSLFGPLELKNIGDFSSAKAYEEDPHLHHQIQLQIQIACLDSTWGSLAALFPGYNLVWKDLERNDDFLETVYPELENFWRHVVDKVPPPVESHRDLEVVKRLYPADSGETVALDIHEMGLVNDWQARKKEAKEKETRAKELEAHLRAAMGDATWGALPDGTFLSLKTTKCKGYTSVVDSLPYEYRTLRRTKTKK